jgi:hypothetical protein
MGWREFLAAVENPMGENSEAAEQNNRCKTGEKGFRRDARFSATHILLACETYHFAGQTLASGSKRTFSTRPTIGRALTLSFTT